MASMDEGVAPSIQELTAKMSTSMAKIYEDIERLKVAETALRRQPSLNKTGFLTISSSNKQKRRWFVLKNNVLYCFKTPEDVKPEEIILVEECRVGNQKKFAFEIFAASRSYLLCAKTTEEREEWVDALKRASKLTIEEFYQIGDTLGTGTFSKVKLGVHKKTGEKYAIKIIDKSCFSKNKESLMTEIAILQTVEHPNIVALKEIFETNRSIYLVMELLTGGELFDRIVDKGSFSEKDASVIVYKILSAVKYLHDRGIVHRDLKPENLLNASNKDDSDIKIADFGLSKFVGLEDVLRTPCGTPGYVAPEVLMLQGYDKAVDLWSIGVIMYILLCGFPPFYAESDAELFEIIKRGKFSFPAPYWNNVSESAKDLIRCMLRKSSMDRITADEALCHPWVSQAHTVPSEPVPSVIAAMRRYNAVRKFKRTILVAIAGNRLRNSISGPSGRQAREEARRLST